MRLSWVETIINLYWSVFTWLFWILSLITYIHNTLDNAMSRTPPKSNTCACFLILYLERALNHLNVSNTIRGKFGEKGVDFGRMHGWYWAKVGLNLSRYWFIASNDKFICIHNKDSIFSLDGMLVLVWEQFGHKIRAILDVSQDGLGCLLQWKNGDLWTTLGS